MTEPNIITQGNRGGYGWLPISDLAFCKGVVAAINRDPDRRAKLELRSNKCRVVDYSRPIRVRREGGKRDSGPILGWELIE